MFGINCWLPDIPALLQQKSEAVHMIYLFSSLDTFSDEDFHRALNLLPPARKEYALHFRQIQDQKRTVIGYLLLLCGLRKEYGITDRPEIVTEPSGKPYLHEKNMPFFNISHSGNCVACALHSSEIGVDIQKTVPLRPSLIQRVCTPGEKGLIQTDEDFCRLWTRKESVSKLTGEGISGSFQNILDLHPEIDTISQPLEGGRYYLSYSVRR